MTEEYRPHSSGDKTAEATKPAYQKTTQDIEIRVEPHYLTEQSSPSDDHYVWAYHVKIINNSDETVQLLSRYWKITDARGIHQEVEGDGVVGEQPIIAAGASYEYTSGTPLSTPSGFMLGHYNMMSDKRGMFIAEVPAFSLDSPFTDHILH